MAFFYIIDNSLTRIGGHHYEYTRCVSQAAIDFGFSCVVGTHKKFDPAIVDSSRSEERLPGSSKYQHTESKLVARAPLDDQSKRLKWRPVFRNTTYQRDSLLPGLANLKSKNCGEAKDQRSDGLLNWWNQALQLRRRRSLVRSFAYDCEAFFNEFEFTTDDHVLLTTVSELELLGLAAYLSNHPRTLQVNWHLQFHFDLLLGRPSEYEQQKPILDNVRHAFMAALARIPYHQINFFVTSQQLADQYNRLGIGEFMPLVYPVDSQFIKMNDQTDPSSEPKDATKTKITVAGAIRREKGQRDQLQSIVDRMWTNHFETGNAQLVIQRKPGNHFKGPKFRLSFPDKPELPEEEQAIIYVNHPCPKDEYVNLIKSSNVGLLCYDSRVYYSRRAGVLCEFLAAGIPVVVPSGCWLSEQLAPLHYQYVDELVKQFAREESIARDQSDMSISNVPLQGGVWSFDQLRHPFNLSCRIQLPVSAVAIQFHWNWPRKTGAYCDVCMTQLDSSGTPIRETVQTVGFASESSPAGVLFNIDKASHAIKFTFSNAYADETASICSAKIVGLSVPHTKQIPIGCVGAVANSREDYVEAIEEVLNNLEHYRDTARRFSTQWAKTHLPMRTVARLIAAERTSINVA